MNVANNESVLSLLQQSLQQAITEKNSPNIAATVEQILNITPADVGLHQLLGEVFPVLSTKEDAREQFQTLVDKWPYAYSSRLVLAI
jgi:hypothetical protein